jgi:hypothetical protein
LNRKFFIVEKDLEGKNNSDGCDKEVDIPSTSRMEGEKWLDSHHPLLSLRAYQIDLLLRKRRELQLNRRSQGLWLQPPSAEDGLNKRRAFQLESWL